jgi:beta-catenin-like protein 1
LERAIDKNQDQRSKYPNDPTKFIDSEADLDAAIKSLMQLSQFPALAYPELVKSETIGLLIGLLSHENMDIVIDVVELIHELTDEDVGGEEEDGAEEGEENKRDIVMKMLVDKLVSIPGFFFWMTTH